MPATARSRRRPLRASAASAAAAGRARSPRAERSAARSCSARRCAGRGPRAWRRRCGAAASAWPPGCERSACETVGDLLEHLPERQPRGAHGRRRCAPASRRRCRSRCARSRARPVRRRGMRPLVEASVFDASGTMRATFFNQPWLVERYPPGTRLLLHGKADGARRLRRLPPRARRQTLPAGSAGRRRARARPVAHYPAAEGVSSTQILTLVQGARERSATCPSRSRRRRACAEGLPDRASALAAMHFPRAPERPRGRPAAAGLRGAAADPARCSCAAAPRAARSAAARRARRADRR